MTDRVFYINRGPFKLSEIAQLILCEIGKNVEDKLIKNVKALSEAGSEDISFLNNIKYLKEFQSTKAGVCIVPKDFSEDSSNVVLLRSSNPYYAYAQVVDLFYEYGKSYTSTIASSAKISESAKIGKNCFIGHNVVVDDLAEIGDNCIIEANSVIDYKVKVGNNAKIYSNVSISHAVIGNDVVILPGAKIGQDGFGFATNAGIHKKIYHIGKVVIGDNVEIGANTTIDRGSMGDTIIEDLCRIDNLVQIGHNVHIKKGAIIVAQVGIAGSSTIGSYCALGGQVGIAGHINIADKVQLAGQAGVIQDITEAGVYGGTPALPIKDWHKQTIILRKMIKK